MVTAPNEPGFRGHIGRTYQDSTAWWPDPPAGLGRPNVVLIVLDDTGFAHFGCYGSELATPNIDRLAANGLRYTSFHTTALCSPSRASLLTGRNPHAVGMRGVSNWNTGFPHMRGGISPRAATVAEMLRPHGYATYAAGKWHLAPMDECSAAGPHANWPLQKGFDRFYGFLQGETDQFYPELTSDNGHVDPPVRPEDGYHVSEDILGRATGWISDLQFLGIAGEFLGPVGEVASLVLIYIAVIEAFSEGRKERKRTGYSYGMCWEAFGEPNHDKVFYPWAGDSAEELREAFFDGVQEGREKARDPKLHNSLVLLAARYELSGVDGWAARTNVLNDVAKQVDPEFYHQLEWPKPHDDYAI